MKTWVEQRIEEYRLGARRLEQYKTRLLNGQDRDRVDNRLKMELKLVNGMISEMRYAIEYMRLGHKPRHRRGAEAHDAYQYAELMDMDNLLLPALDLSTEPVEMTDEQKRSIVKVLMRMSKRERECYLLHMAQGLSLSEIADELKIKKGTVQDYIKRAKSKAQQAI